MPIVEKKILLSAATPELWNFITDPDHFGEYVQGYSAGELLTENATGPDSAFRWKSPLGPFTLDCEEKVVEWTENEKVAYEGEMAGGRFHSEMMVRPVGAGTELTVRVDYSAPFGPAGRAIDSLFLRREVENHIADSLEKLRGIFEAPAGAPADPGASGGKAVRSMYSMWGRTGLYDASASLTFMFREKEIRGRAAELLSLVKGDRVLDLCCGTGLNFAHIQRGVGPAGEITALDYTRAMLDRAEERAEKNGWKNINIIQGDAARLCFPDETFDAVLCVLGISAVPDFSSALEHAVRVCRPGGRVVICDGHPFKGRLEPLNAAMVPVFRRLACWDHTKDIPALLEKMLDSFTLQWFNAGTIYIASGVR